MADMKSNQVFDWDAVAGAVTYEAEVQQGGVTISSKTGLTSPSVSPLQFTNPQALVQMVSYMLRVRAVDAYGPGAWSSLFAFRIVGLDAPINILIV